jgi:hypothetical protein
MRPWSVAVGTAPIAVFVGGHIATPSGAVPPQLREMTVKVNHHGPLQSKGLPTCTLSAIETASSQRALSQCSDALVGSGRFWASVVFPDQRPYPTRGRKSAPPLAVACRLPLRANRS